jgi:hypothetical protein
VARVAAAFANNGAGVRGDLKAVWTAILLDDEARSPQGLTSTTHGKLREPMVRFIQWGRSFGIRSAANSWKLFDLSNPATQLGQTPLRAPSVFNFFRPGFVPPNTELARTASVAPEFQIVNETSVGGYLNFIRDAIRVGLFVPEPNLVEGAFRNYVADITCSYTAELALVNDPIALVRRVVLLMSANQISQATQDIMVQTLNATALPANPSDSQKLDRVAAAIFMVMACPEYLVQK